MVPGEQPADIERAIAQLKSFHGNELSVLAVIGCGARAIPALRAMLFARERSGLYQPRCRAVAALAMLGAHSTLIEFLETDRSILDPIERVGEDAVINAAALAVAKLQEQRVFEVLLRLARRPCLSGVIAALGGFGRAEAIPLLISALEEDGSRLTAENALKKLGPQTRAALVRTLATKWPSSEQESESSARRRRTALQLFAELNPSRKAWSHVRHLVHDSDPQVATLACEMALDRAPEREQRGALQRLITLLTTDDWFLQMQIEDCLLAHFGSAQPVIERYLGDAPRPIGHGATGRQTELVLHRVMARAARSAPKAQ